MGILKQNDQLLFQRDEFGINLRKAIQYDLQNSSDLLAEPFYLEKMYDFLFDSAQRSCTNETMYQICGRDVEQIMLQQLGTFGNSLNSAGLDDVQNAILRLLAIYVQNKSDE